MPKFDFEEEQKEATWLVDRLIPLGQLAFVLAQAGVGKSLFLNSLSMAIIHDMPYADLDVVGGNVLLIDQDTPEDVLKRRIKRWNNGMETHPKYELYVESMKGYSLSDGTLTSIIKDYSQKCVLIIVDCFHSVIGQRLNPNCTSDMGILAKLKSKCLNGNSTILFNHHISQHNNLKLEELMTGNTGHLAMGNSGIIQQADSYYILGASAIEGRTEKIFVRPVSKRVSIPTAPIILRLVETDTGERLYYDGKYEIGLQQVESHVLMLFREHKDMEYNIKEVYDKMGHRHGEKAIRTALDVLEEKGWLMMSKGKSNMFKYKLARSFKKEEEENNNGMERKSDSM